MLAVAEIIRLHGAAYRAHVGDRLLPSQARVLRDLAACRTAYFGGHLTQCDNCERQVFRYHSCEVGGGVGRENNEARSNSPIHRQEEKSIAAAIGEECVPGIGHGCPGEFLGLLQTDMLPSINPRGEVFCGDGITAFVFPRPMLIVHSKDSNFWPRTATNHNRNGVGTCSSQNCAQHRFCTAIG